MGPLESRGTIVDIRRALSMGGAAVVAAAVGAACSFAFSGAIALNDAAGVQVSDSPVIVSSTRTTDSEFRPPRSPDAAGPEIVPAPEPHDLGSTTRRSPAGDVPRGDAGAAADDRPSGATGGDGQSASPGGDGPGASPGERLPDTAWPGGDVSTPPGLTGGTPATGTQSGARGNREWAHQHAPGLNKTSGTTDARGQAKAPGKRSAPGQSANKRPGDSEQCGDEGRARGPADSPSDSDAPRAGGG